MEFLKKIVIVSSIQLHIQLLQQAERFLHSGKLASDVEDLLIKIFLPLQGIHRPVVVLHPTYSQTLNMDPIIFLAYNQIGCGHYSARRKEKFLLGRSSKSGSFKCTTDLLLNSKG